SRKAGYHGGASLSETAVPVLVLRPRPLEDTEPAWIAELPDGWVFAGDQRPLWWSIRPETSPAEHVETRIESVEQDGMLDLYGNGAPTSQPREATGLGTAIIATPRYADQKKGLRRTPPDEAVAALVDELAAAPSTRLPLSRVSQLLATPAARTGRVAGVVAQVLNVEGFEVLRLEDDTVILDASLAREQFKVHGCAPTARASPPGGATTSSERCAAAPSHPRDSTARHRPGPLRRGTVEIGRASCRESVDVQ